MEKKVQKLFRLAELWLFWIEENFQNRPRLTITFGGNQLGQGRFYQYARQAGWQRRANGTKDTVWRTVAQGRITIEVEKPELPVRYPVKE